MDGQTTDGRRMPRGRKEGIRIAGGFAQQMAAPLAAQMERKEATDGPQIKLCSLCGHRRPRSAAKNERERKEIPPWVGYNAKRKLTAAMAILERPRRL